MPWGVQPQNMPAEELQRPAQAQLVSDPIGMQGLDMLGNALI
jgi:hypothetical protein